MKFFYFVLSFHFIASPLFYDKLKSEAQPAQCEIFKTKQNLPLQNYGQVYGQYRISKHGQNTAVQVQEREIHHWLLGMKALCLVPAWNPSWQVVGSWKRTWGKSMLAPLSHSFPGADFDSCWRQDSGLEGPLVSHWVDISLVWLLPNFLTYSSTLKLKLLSLQWRTDCEDQNPPDLSYWISALAIFPLLPVLHSRLQLDSN